MYSSVRHYSILPVLSTYSFHRFQLIFMLQHANMSEYNRIVSSVQARREILGHIHKNKQILASVEYN